MHVELPQREPVQPALQQRLRREHSRVREAQQHPRLRNQFRAEYAVLELGSLAHTLRARRRDARPREQVAPGGRPGCHDRPRDRVASLAHRGSACV